jgi:hypothetical protein
MGAPDENSMLATALYDIQSSDESKKLFLANTLGENTLNSVDEDGYHSKYLGGILKRSVSNNAESKENMMTCYQDWHQNNDTGYQQLGV